MEQYREKLEMWQKLTAAAMLVLVGFSVLFGLSECGVVSIAPAGGDDHWQSLWRGFICGACTGIAGLMLAALIRITKALRSEKALKRLYVRAHDERQIKIWTTARATATQIFLLVGLVAGIVAGYFSMTVGITIIACVVVNSLIALVCKLYYSGKY